MCQHTEATWQHLYQFPSVMSHGKFWGEVLLAGPEIRSDYVWLKSTPRCCLVHFFNCKLPWELTKKAWLREVLCLNQSINFSIVSFMMINERGLGDIKKRDVIHLSSVCKSAFLISAKYSVCPAIFSIKRHLKISVILIIFNKCLAVYSTSECVCVCIHAYMNVCILMVWSTLSWPLLVRH